MAKKKKILSEIERKKLTLDSELKDLKEKIEFGMIPMKPTRKFKVDERIIYGAHKETYVREICENGLYYLIESMSVKRSRDTEPQDELRYVPWMELDKYNEVRETSFAKKEDYRINQNNSMLSSLLHKVYHSGVDFDVEYQREHVWTKHDKVALIDSIFNNIDIGKFVFVQRDYSFRGKLYEIIDGKQRLTAICEFYEDRFKYKGKFFSELSPSDRNVFEDHPIVYGYLVNPSKRAIFETFIKLNTCGKPMKNKHIEHVKDLLNEI